MNTQAVSDQVGIETYDNPYADQIRNFFQTEFPAQMEKTSSDVLELVTNALLATGKIRLGPKPTIEGLYQIRQVLSKRIAAGEPIPLLMPWGSEKPVHHQVVDLAEVAAIKTLSCLQQRVSAVYSPGVNIRVRVEDASAPSLFFTAKEQARTDALIYTKSLLKLRDVLGAYFTEFIPESTLTTETEFNGVHDALWPLFLQYLKDSNSLPQDFWAGLASYRQLVDLGWSGTISQQQRDYYLTTYRKLYGADDALNYEMLARYLAQSLVRKNLGLLGNLDWKEWIGLSFVGPVPGEPKARTANRIYYRTLPENVSTLHMPPWRAKGYLRIGDGIPSVRLMSWNENRSLHEGHVQLSGNGESVVVQTDYEVL